MAADACNPKRATIALACGLVVFFMVQSSARPEAHGGSNAHAQLLGEDGRLLQDVGSLSADRLAARYARYQQSKYSSEHKKPRVLTYRPDSAKSNAVLEDDYDVIMVGAGLSGGVLAERLARLAGAKVLLLDKRDHIGGNCYDYLDPDAHVLVNRVSRPTPHCARHTPTEAGAPSRPLRRRGALPPHWLPASGGIAGDAALPCPAARPARQLMR